MIQCIECMPVTSVAILHSSYVYCNFIEEIPIFYLFLAQGVFKLNPVACIIFVYVYLAYILRYIIINMLAKHYNMRARYLYMC